MLSKYVWSISVEKISFIRSCDVEERKAMDYIIKVHITSGNIKWRSFALRFCASNHKSTWQPLLPSAKGLSFIIILYLMQESQWSSPFLFHFILWQAQHVGKNMIIYISNWVWGSMNYYYWHYPWGKRLWGKTISPYLSLCLIKTVTTSIAWVLVIVKD